MLREEFLGFLEVQTNYRKVGSSNSSRLEAHAGFFQIAYEGYFRQEVDFLISNVR